MSQANVIGADFAQALAAASWDRVEELWLEALGRDPIPTAELFEVRRALWEAGRRSLARTLLELLAEALEAAGRHRDALLALRELVRLSDGKPSPELLGRLVRALAAARSGSPSLAKVLEHHDIASARRPLELLEAAERWLDHDSGTVVEVVGQGVGRVIDLNLQLENIKVDLGARRPVSVPFGAVERYLRPLPEGDFRRRKVEDAAALAEFVERTPAEALVQILESLGQPADVAAIKTTLEGVLPAERWTSWWAKARKHPRILSSGAGSRLRYAISGSAADADATLLEELRRAEPADRPLAARRLAERSPEGAAAAAAVLLESLPELERRDPGLAWVTAGIIAGLPEGAEAAAASRRRLLERGNHLGLLHGISDRGARSEALDAIAESAPALWPEVWGEWFLHEESTASLMTIARRLGEAGHQALLDQAVEAVFRNHAEHAAQFVWACEVMTEDGCPEAVRARMTPSLLEKLPDTLTRKEFAGMRGRAKALLDGGRVAVRLLMESATTQQAARFSQRIARIDAVEPQRARLIEQAANHRREVSTAPAAPILAASRRAVEARREELRRLLEEEIPRTLKGINSAAAEGDLRENFEYHMLRDRQELQSARAAKIQEELAVVRILEPGAADNSAINIGTIVHFEDLDGVRVEPLTILGAWDADLERRIFANGSDLAQRLLGRRVGDEAEIEEGTVTIARIEAWTDDS
ncbi:MAG: GreA/GreB family elongation factor [Thermoanaerobaculales bacterium]|jgi:transcription elongation factor GreA|nr:GreA/GreB family elongation factor [Thermoanaerobaculales bacterium]